MTIHGNLSFSFEHGHIDVAQTAAKKLTLHYLSTLCAFAVEKLLSSLLNFRFTAEARRTQRTAKK